MGTTAAAAGSAAVDMKKAMVASLCTVLAIVMIIASMVMPWYTVSFSGGGDTSTVDYTFQGGTIHNATTSETRTWANYTEEYKADHNGTAPQAPGLYMMTMYLLVGGLVMGALSIPVGFMVGKGKVKPMVVMIVGVLAFVLTIGAFGMFLTGHVGAMANDLGSSFNGLSDGPNKSFQGSASPGGGFSLSWGPAIGYWLALVAAIFYILGMVFGAMSMKKPAAAAGGAPPSS